MIVRAGVLDVEVRRSGEPDGWPVVLLHGFPYDAHSFDRVAERIVVAGTDQFDNAERVRISGL